MIFSNFWTLSYLKEALERGSKKKNVTIDLNCSNDNYDLLQLSI